MNERRWSLPAEDRPPGLAGHEGVDEVEVQLVHLSVGARLDRLGTVLQEHFASGGKRIRARIALAAGEALGLDRAAVVPWAAACEILHNATLVHDDLQDGDEVRRGHPTVWAAHGHAQAINAGDLMLTLPYLALRALKAPDAVKWRLSEATARRAEQTVRGQAVELDLLSHGKLRWHEWAGAARGKSGALLALPVEGAALLSGLDEPTARKLAEPFATLGLTYQACDDIVDLWGDKGRGAIGNDVREGKVSALVAAHLALHPEDEPALVATLRRPREETSDAEVEGWIDRFARGGARAQVEQFMAKQVEEVLTDPTLSAVPPLHALAEELLGLLMSSCGYTAGGRR